MAAGINRSSYISHEITHKPRFVGSFFLCFQLFFLYKTPYIFEDKLEIHAFCGVKVFFLSFKPFLEISFHVCRCPLSYVKQSRHVKSFQLYTLRYNHLMLSIYSTYIRTRDKEKNNNNKCQMERTYLVFPQ